jgi:hypothetical protein
VRLTSRSRTAARSSVWASFAAMSTTSVTG